MENRVVRLWNRTAERFYKFFYFYKMNTTESLSPSREIISIDDLDFSRRYTIGDYLQWKFDDLVELIRGKIFRMSPSPNIWHQEISYNLTIVLSENFRIYRKKGCRIYVAPTDVFLVEKSKELEDGNVVVVPDICIACNPSKKIFKGYAGVPDFMLEILSPHNSKRDLVYKHNLYEEFQVPEYWIVNPKMRTIQRHILKDGIYEKLKVNREGDVVAPQNFPKLKVELAEVFDEIPPAEEW